MEITTIAKYIRISPRKARVVTDVIRGMSPSAALTALKFIPKKASLPIAKAIKTAIADAKHNFGAEVDKLTFKKILIEEGPRLKRVRPVGHGRAHPYKKRMSHIKIVLEAEEPEKPKVEEKEKEAEEQEKPVKTENKKEEK